MLVGDIGVRHLIGTDEVVAPDFPGFTPDGLCQSVDDLLDRKADARARDAALGSKRRFIGCHGKDAATIRRQLVRPGKIAASLRGLEAGGERPD